MVFAADHRKQDRRKASDESQLHSEASNLSSAPGPGPSLFLASMSARCFSSSSTMESWPWLAATVRAVSPRRRLLSAGGCTEDWAMQVCTAAFQLTAKMLNTQRDAANIAAVANLPPQPRNQASQPSLSFWVTQAGSFLSTCRTVSRLPSSAAAMTSSPVRREAPRAL